ncbi:MAG: peptide deformylase [Pseudomonadota bacterium]
MSLRPLVLLPDPILRKVSEPIAQVNDEVRAFAQDMLDTMYDAPGIGLAAIQVGEPIRMLVMDVAERAAGEEEDAHDAEPPRAPMVLINPKMQWLSDERGVYEEGCLSIPDYYAEVERPAEAKVDYIDLDGKEQQLHATGLLSTCLQHEIDHLDGKLFIDYLSKLKRDMVVRKFTKLSKQNPTAMLG